MRTGRAVAPSPSTEAIEYIILTYGRHDATIYVWVCTDSAARGNKFKFDV
jgi:hypothetical protein